MEPIRADGGNATLGAGGGGTWMLLSETRFLYDGRRVIQERDGSNTPLVSYTRGKDLSGSLEGAGGIGGLLARSHGYSSGNWSTHNFYHADGGGNVTYLVNSSQTLSASYRYDPYGNLISSSGSLASANIYRFSSKPIHAASGLYYYGERFYEPNLQRWLNRDPIGEWGGINLYGFVGNDPANKIDPLGWNEIGYQDYSFPADDLAVQSAWIEGFIEGFLDNFREDYGEINGQPILGGSPPLPGGKGLQQGGKLLKDAAKKLLDKCKKWGSKGKPDHQKKVQELVEKLQKEARPGERVLQEKKIQGYDSNRRPDAQLLDKTGKTKQIQEAERYPNRQRNKNREAEYDELEIPNETSPLE
jgi:RHS repeat-associated protein